MEGTVLKPTVSAVCVQRRALLTYFRRIYYPFLQQQPSLHSLPSGLIMLWTHTQPAMLDAGAEAAVLAAAVVIPALANLAEAATAIQSIAAQQGMQRNPSRCACVRACVCVCVCVRLTSSWAHWRVGTGMHVGAIKAMSICGDCIG